jgi:hypothetical protein
MKPVMQAAMKHQNAAQVSSMPTTKEPTTPVAKSFHVRSVQHNSAPPQW